MDDERMQILKRVEAGEISVEEGVRQIAALGQAPSDEAESEVSGSTPEAAASRPLQVPKGLAEFWRYPLYVGVGLVVLGAIILFAVYGVSASGLWAVCGWPLFALGVLITATAWWLHLRVTGKDRVAISFPLPLKLTAWAIRIARPFVPQFKDTGVDELIMGLSDTLKDSQPLYVDVTDDDKGEHVQIYIG